MRVKVGHGVGWAGGVGWVTDRVRDDSILYLGLPNHGSPAVLQLAYAALDEMKSAPLFGADQALGFWRS